MFCQINERETKMDSLDWREDNAMSTTVIPAFISRPPEKKKKKKEPRLSRKNDIRENRSRRHLPWSSSSSSRLMQRHGLRHVDLKSLFFSYACPVKATTGGRRGAARGWKTRGSHQSFFSRRGNKMSGTGFIRPQFRKSRARLLSARARRKNTDDVCRIYSYAACRCEIQKLREHAASSNLYRVWELETGSSIWFCILYIFIIYVSYFIMIIMIYFIIS